LVIGFIGYLQVVATNNCNTFAGLHTTITPHVSSQSISTSLHYPFPGNRFITVTLYHKLPIPLHYSTHEVFNSHVKFSQVDLFYSSVLLVPIRSELTAHGSRYIAAERTRTYSKRISRDRYPASLLARRSDLQKTQLTLVLRVGPCIQRCCLATR
jgi:hypothetical protein